MHYKFSKVKTLSPQIYEAFIAHFSNTAVLISKIYAKYYENGKYIYTHTDHICICMYSKRSYLPAKGAYQYHFNIISLCHSHTIFHRTIVFNYAFIFYERQ